jgi:prepilin-type N-terminal cleavage/methylation domain-containing protein
MMGSKQRGFSLVELMVALLLGTLITAAAVQMFITNQRSFRLQQTMSEVQETGRFAAELISKELRMAGLTRADGTESGGVIVASGYEGQEGQKVLHEEHEAHEEACVHHRHSQAARVCGKIVDFFGC